MLTAQGERFGLRPGLAELFISAVGQIVPFIRASAVTPRLLHRWLPRAEWDRLRALLDKEVARYVDQSNKICLGCYLPRDLSP